MQLIEKNEVKKYLGLISEVKTSHVLFDSHVHPFELFRKASCLPPTYTMDYNRKIGSSQFKDSEVTAIIVNGGFQTNTMLKLFSRSEVLEQKFDRLYRDAGPGLFAHHMELSGIDKALLLPVAPAQGSADDQLALMSRLYGQDDRFILAWTVSNCIQKEDILSEAIKAVSDYRIKAVKIHPNVTELNLGSEFGRERVESILDCCGKLGLPLVIHGGRSTLLRNSEASNYGLIGNLKNINWARSKATVVISHGAAYGCDADEIINDVLPSLKQMLTTYDNLMIDVSGLDLGVMLLILKNIEFERILFGSDALYEPQWKMIVRLLYSLKQVTSRFVDSFVKIVSTNPARLLNLDHVA